MRHLYTEEAAATATAEYAGEIFEAICMAEQAKSINVELIDSQPDIDWTMRPRLLAFLFEAHEALRLRPETMTLAVSILDRYSSRRIVYARHYQLVGCVSLLVAAKFLDDKRRVPSVSDLSYLCANAFAPHMFSEMERHILETLQWDVSAPTSLEFLDILFLDLCQSGCLPARTPAEIPHYTAMAQYMCMCALFNREMIAYGPRAVATAAVELTCAILASLTGEFPGQSFRLSGTIRECFDSLVALIVSPPPQISAWTSKSEYNVPALIQQFFAATYDQSEDDCSTCSTPDNPEAWYRLPRTPDTLSPLVLRKPTQRAASEVNSVWANSESHWT